MIDLLFIKSYTFVVCHNIGKKHIISYLKEGVNVKLLRQCTIILSIYFLGELIKKGLSLPIPGSILGMLILLFLLCTKIIKLDMVEGISNFFLDNLAFFFIPSGVSLMSSFSVLKGNWLAIISISIISTIIVLSVTGAIIQLISKGRNHEGNDN